MRRGKEAHGLFDKPFVSWRDDVALFMGPRLAGFSAIDARGALTVHTFRRREPIRGPPHGPHAGT